MNKEEMKFVGGHLCLDFINTVDAWADAPARSGGRRYGDTPLREKLVDYEALVSWGQLASMLSAREASQLQKCARSYPGAAAAVHGRALRLRRSIYRLLKSVIQEWRSDPVDIEVLHRELSLAHNHERLVHYSGRFTWRWEGISEDRPAALERMLWPLPGAAAELLTSEELDRLRQCKGEECGWLFLDTSRNHSRLWCDMADCGNLDKVRRFRQRRAAAPPTRQSRSA